jgi:Tol biopolymer transport system component
MARGAGDDTTTTIVDQPPASLHSDAILFQTHDGIWAINPDGTARTQLSSANAWSIDWAPDHQRFAWMESLNGADGRRIHVTSIDGSSDQVLTPDAGGAPVRPFYGVAWSPDGTQIAYTCDQFELCVVDVATSVARNLSLEDGLGGSDQVQVSAGDWSPDGRLLSYVASDGSGPQPVATMNVVDIGAATHWALHATSPFTIGGVFTGDGAAVLHLTASGDAMVADPVAGGPNRAVPAGSGEAVTGRSPDGNWFVGNCVAGGCGPLSVFSLDGQRVDVPNTDDAGGATW